MASAWWRHQMEIFSALLALCAGKSPVPGEFPDQWRGALMFSLICARINGWVNNCEAGDLRRYRAHYDVIVMANGCGVEFSGARSDWGDVWALKSLFLTLTLHCAMVGWPGPWSQINTMTSLHWSKFDLSKTFFVIGFDSVYVYIYIHIYTYLHISYHTAISWYLIFIHLPQIVLYFCLVRSYSLLP